MKFRVLRLELAVRQACNKLFTKPREPAVTHHDYLGIVRYLATDKVHQDINLLTNQPRIGSLVSNLLHRPLQLLIVKRDYLVG